MPGRIDLESDGRTLRISFEYRQDLLDKVRRVPGRSWDAGGRIWRVPVVHADAAIDVFRGCGFEVSAGVSAILTRTSTAGGELPFPGVAPVAAARPDAPEAPAGAEALTVSALNRRVQSAVAAGIPDCVWVTGEVAGYDRNKQQPHRFFELVEKEPDAAGQRSRVSAVLFASAAARIQARALAHSEPLELRDGIEVRVKARVEVYVPKGQYQLVVEDVDTEFTLGKLALLRRRVLAELDRLGLRERNASLPWPEAPLRVGLMTSPGSDAFTDFMNELSRSGFAFDVWVYPIAVQGKELERTLTAGLRWFARRRERFDILCITRGGGARTDLAWFDNLELALAVARHPLKVLCGIGHQRDVSILDVISHSEKTPTAAAAVLVAKACAARDRVDESLARILDAAAAILARQRQLLGTLGRRLSVGARGSLAAAAQDGRHRTRRLALGSRDLVRRSGAEVERHLARLPALALARVHLERERVEGKDARRRALDPREVLRRGFAILRDAGGRIRPSARGLAAGESVGIEMRDGTLGATVTRPVAPTSLAAPAEERG